MSAQTAGQMLPQRSSTPLLEIDLGAVAANTRSIADRASGELMAVVKADGFGHGAVAVARTALANGATSLGVTSIHEAMELREAGLVAPVLSWLNAPTPTSPPRSSLRSTWRCRPSSTSQRSLPQPRERGGSPRSTCMPTRVWPVTALPPRTGSACASWLARPRRGDTSESWG